jgi:hypothetical protein
MSTRNTKLFSNRDIRPSRPKNPVAKKSFIFKSNIPMKFSQLYKRTTDDQTKFQSFTTKKRQDPDEEMGTLGIKDANKTKVVRSILNSSASVNPSESSTHQRQAAKKRRGKYSPSKNQGSDGGRVKERKDRNIVRKSRMISSVRGIPSWILILLMLSILDVVQALTDCQIMHDWLPKMFDGTACCKHSHITCHQGDWGRITAMYVDFGKTNPLFRNLPSKELTGLIPSSIGDLSSLSFLVLRDNLLNGTIPSSIGDLSVLHSLELSGNLLNGSIPESFGKLTMLSVLSLQNNQLSGTIPASFGELGKSLTASNPNQGFKHLDISFNQLSGVIPSSLGGFLMMDYLNLQSNQLSGEIPSSFGGLLQLDVLSLGNNQLSGSIPSIGKLSNLDTLELQNNLLGGSIPSLISLKYLQKLLLSNNSLTGPVPELSSTITSCELSNNTGLCALEDHICTESLATCNLDCRMMNAWLPKMFDDSTCCSQTGIGCSNNRITNLYKKRLILLIY